MKLYDVIRREKTEEKEEDTTSEVFTFSEPPKKKRRRIIFIAIILSSLALVYILGLYFVRVTVFIEERKIPFTLDKALIDLSHETQSDTERLSFQTMTVTTEISRDIFGSQLRETTGKAKGSVVFFNEYTKSSVTLKSGTRLIATNGKSYLTQKSVTIPGYKMDGKKKLAGTSPSIAVIASETGPSANSSGTSLSISGYTGTKKTQLYARSVGGFTGGEAGMRHTVSEAERPEIIETLKTQLAERLRRETRTQIPEQLITYPELQFISIDTDSIKLEGEGVKFPARIKGTMVSYLIPRDLFESALAKEALSDHSYTSVSIPLLADLKVSAKSGIPVDPNIVPESITIEVSGQGYLITKVDPARIRLALTGIKKSSFKNTLSNIPEISSAKFRILPFWAPIFPKEERYIKVDLR